MPTFHKLSRRSTFLPTFYYVEETADGRGGCSANRRLPVSATKSMDGVLEVVSQKAIKIYMPIDLVYVAVIRLSLGKLLVNRLQVAKRTNNTPLTP